MDDTDNKDAIGKETTSSNNQVNFTNSWNYGTPSDMENEDSKEDKKAGAEKIWMKILVPLLLLALVAAVWAFKGSGKKQTETANPDFALVVEAIDFEKLKSYGLPMLIDFGSEGCSPCRLMYPTLVTLNEEWQGKVIVKFTDVWKYTSAADGYPVTVIPTQFFFYADGRPFVPSNPAAVNLKMYENSLTGEHVFTSHEGFISEEELREIFTEMGVK